jgi:signal transduction histidine kinase
VSIKDEGVGFNEVMMEQLFERFTKVGKMGTMGEVSTGLGCT